jgi:hypothetical protein
MTTKQHDPDQPDVAKSTKSKSKEATGRPDPGDEGDGNAIFEAQEEWREQQKELTQEQIEEAARLGK